MMRFFRLPIAEVVLILTLFMLIPIADFLLDCHKLMTDNDKTLLDVVRYARDRSNAPGAPKRINNLIPITAEHYLLISQKNLQDDACVSEKPR